MRRCDPLSLVRVEKRPKEIESLGGRIGGGENITQKEGSGGHEHPWVGEGKKTGAMDGKKKT